MENLDYLRQFDVFVAFSDYYYSGKRYYYWSDYLAVASNTLSLVEAGKSILVIELPYYPSPASSFASARGYDLSNEKIVDLVVTPSPITMGVKSLIYRGRYLLGLSGRYPAVSTPKTPPGMPDPPVSLVIYGQYGNGKYVILSYQLLSGDVSGDVGVLLSNIMHWLTNRDIPPPPSLVDLDQRISEMNKTLDSLSHKIQQLSKLADQLTAQLPGGGLESQVKQIGVSLVSLEKHVDRIDRSLSEINGRVDQLLNELSRVKATVSKLETPMRESATGQANLAVPISVAVLSLLMSIIALVISITRRRQFLNKENLFYQVQRER